MTHSCHTRSNRTASSGGRTRTRPRAHVHAEVAPAAVRQGRCHHAPELSAGAHRHGCARGVPIARVSTTCGAATRDTSHAERTRYARDTDTAARGVCRSLPRHGAICRWRAVHCRTHMNCRLTGTNHPQTYAFRARTHTHTHRQKRKHTRTQARALQANTDKHTQSKSPHATPDTDTNTHRRPLAHPALGTNETPYARPA